MNDIVVVVNTRKVIMFQHRTEGRLPAVAAPRATAVHEVEDLVGVRAND
jgi:hypothetical protein